MAATEYWVADPEGYLAPATGAASRDRLLALGWVAATEPKPFDQVWHYHPELGAFSRFSAAILPVWEARGWVPAAPPMVPGDIGPVIELPPPGALPSVPEVAEPVTAEAPAAAESKTEKEKSRG